MCARTVGARVAAADPTDSAAGRPLENLVEHVKLPLREHRNNQIARQRDDRDPPVGSRCHPARTVLCGTERVEQDYQEERDGDRQVTMHHGHRTRRTKMLWPMDQTTSVVAAAVRTLNSAQNHPANRAPARRPREPMTRRIRQADR
jgi:hypothetical protein